MSPRRDLVRGASLRVAIGATALLLLAGAGLGAHRVLEEEAAQARVLVDDGQRALAREDRGRAVLALERAWWLAPRAGFVRAALAAVAPPEAGSVVPHALRLVTAREWAGFATVSGWLAGLACAMVIARGRRGRVGGAAAVAAGAFMVGLVGVMAWNGSSLAVVTTSDGAALLAPYLGAAVVGPLHAGATVVLGPRHDGFVQVRGDDGLTGWVPERDLEAVAGPAG